MDGTLAIIFAVIGLIEMAYTECPTGCVSQRDASSRIWIQAGPTSVESEEIRGYKSSEMTIGYDFGRTYGPFQPMASLGLTADGDVWLGAGVKWRIEPNGFPLFLEGSLQPGFHLADGGPDMGSDFHFKTAIGVGYEFDNGSAVLVSVDHRSNADLFGDVNPGMESVTIQYSMTFE